jgi:hypothetical protein
MTDEFFEKQAIIFFNTYESRSIHGKHCFEKDALKFIKLNDEFRKQDYLEASVMVTILENMGYLKFIRRQDHFRYHELTDKGISYLNNRKRKSQPKK